MENRKKSIGLFEATKWMYSFIKVYKKWLLTGAAASGFLIIVNILKAYYTQEIIDNALGGRYEELVKIIGIFVLITLAGVVSEYMSRYATGRYALYATRDMKEKLAQHITRVTMGSIHESRMGDLATRLNNNAERITNFMKNDFLFIALYPVMGLAAIIYVLFINWKLLLVSVVPIPFLMLAAGYLSKKMGELFPKCYELLGRAGARVEEAFLGIDIIKSFNLDGRIHRGVRDIYMDNYKIEFRVYRYLAPMQAVGLSTAWLPRLICALFGGYMALKGEIHVGTLVAVIQLLEYVAFPTAGFAWILGTLRGARAAIERVNEVFNMPEEKEEGCEIMKSNSDVVIEFKDAGFGYEDSKKVISSLSFKLKRGKTVALVGSSGSGKSTVINLICRLYEYNEGKIELYGRDIRELNIRSIRDSIAVVSQDAFLFPGTIAENILQGRKNASMEDVIEASMDAHAHEFIMEMPEGYQTKLGESGVNLSGGQRQRLSIARAFLKDAPILLLDEPTSSLDNHSEALIQESLERLMFGRTVLMVAHRLSTITKADNIMVMNDGSIIEHGTHEELLGKMSYYSQLYNNQLMSSKDEEELKYA